MTRTGMHVVVDGESLLGLDGAVEQRLSILTAQHVVGKCEKQRND